MLDREDQKRQKRESVEPDEIEDERRGIGTQCVDHAEEDTHFRFVAEFVIDQRSHKCAGEGKLEHDDQRDRIGDTGYRKKQGNEI